MAVSIWYEDPIDFWSGERVFEVIPDSIYTYEDRLNRVLRCVMYVSLVATLVTFDMSAMYPLIVTMIITAILAAVYDERDGFAAFPGSLTSGRRRGKARGEAEGERCTRPSRDNPFMNVLMSEYADDPRRPPACELSSVYPDVDRAFNENLFADVEDVYARENAKRAFYTMPSTSIPNDQGSFARWLYKVDGKTCKEGNGQRCPYFTPHAI